MKARVKIGRSSKNLNVLKLVLRDVFHIYIYIYTIYIYIYIYQYYFIDVFFFSFYMNSYALIATQSIITVTDVVMIMFNQLII